MGNRSECRKSFLDSREHLHPQANVHVQLQGVCAPRIEKTIRPEAVAEFRRDILVATGLFQMILEQSIHLLPFRAYTPLTASALVPADLIFPGILQIQVTQRQLLLAGTWLREPGTNLRFCAAAEISGILRRGFALVCSRIE